VSEHVVNILLLITLGLFVFMIAGAITWAHIGMWLTDRRELREYLAGPPEFVVDITGPPVFPPSIEAWDGVSETSKSKARGRAYEAYKEAYDVSWQKAIQDGSFVIDPEKCPHSSNWVTPTYLMGRGTPIYWTRTCQRCGRHTRVYAKDLREAYELGNTKTNKVHVHEDSTPAVHL
jgi:hypothetical protein